MTLQIRTALLAAIPLLLLIPTFNLRVTRLSTWLADSATSRLSAHQIQGLDAIVIDKTDELKVPHALVGLADNSTMLVT